MTNVKYVEDKVIYVKKQRVYNKDLVYPVCEQARIFTEMVRQKTLSSTNIKYIKELGYTVKLQQVSEEL